MRLLAVGAAFVLAIWGWSSHQRHATEHKLGTVASQLAGRPVGVRCQGFWAAMLDINDRAGEVEFRARPAARPHVPDARDVQAVAASSERDRARSELDCLEAIDWKNVVGGTELRRAVRAARREDVEAVNTLTHEAMHLRGFVGEAQAQCYAIQEDAWTVRRLGGTAAEGAAAAALVLALQPLMPSEYQSSACRAGGSLDLRPGTAAFPSESPPQLFPPALTRRQARPRRSRAAASSAARAAPGRRSRARPR